LKAPRILTSVTAIGRKHNANGTYAESGRRVNLGYQEPGVRISVRPPRPTPSIQNQLGFLFHQRDARFHQ
jgi:hypothetical protein